MTGGVRVCSDAVLHYIWSGFAVIFILTHSIAVSKTKWFAVITIRSGFSVKKVSAVTFFRTVGIWLFCKRERSVLFYNASGFII